MQDNAAIDAYLSDIAYSATQARLAQNVQLREETIQLLCRQLQRLQAIVYKERAA